jgi:hypothetical protein
LSAHRKEFVIMGLKKLVIGVAGVALLGVGVAPALASPALPSQTISASPVGNNWQLYSVMPATAKFWAIDKAASDGASGVQFPFQQFDSTASSTWPATTGSWATYLKSNDNVSLTDADTITAGVTWTSGTYVNRGTGLADAQVRLEFQDVSSTGNYTSNDYWWYIGPSGVRDLNTDLPGTLTAPLSDRSNWSNLCGQAATDTASHPGPNCVGGTDPSVSPYDGFTAAMKNIKQVNLSFGRHDRFASGVAAQRTDPATFDMTSFGISSQ